ncbi:hypothetical protein LWM68_40735 [Niabella sp. W65]|nr:hypothetical protein [Niabella sp. W65]MCH7368500.1 hypothetical protein [Niabella sp. W65]
MQDYFFQHKELGICLTYKGLVWLGYSENTLKSAMQRESNSWPFIVHPEDKRARLLPYEECNASRKADITGRLAKRMNCQHTDEACECGNIYNIYQHCTY